MACSWYHTRELTFAARSGRRGGFTVDGAYWKRPDERRNQVKVNSTQLGYNSGTGCFDSKEEAAAHINLFRIHVEQQRDAEGGGAGGGGAGRTKQYSAATRGDTRSGGRDEGKAKAAVEKRRLETSRGGAEKNHVKVEDGLPVLRRGKQVVVEGWAGKAKGLKQVLWERGLWKDGMVQRVKPDDEKGQDMCMQTTLHKCPDFNLEVGALTKLIHDEGHICLFCAKGHPEIAGLGIEYDWGVLKKLFRKINDQVARNMQKHLDTALDAITLTIARKTARRARLYMRAYKTGKAHSHDLIEKFVKIHKCHRNILDQETKYLDKLVHLCDSAKVKLEALVREASTSGLKMYGADGTRLPLPAADAAGAADAADDGEPAAEESDDESVCSLVDDG